MTHPMVDVVCEGNIRRDGKKVVEAHSTCTLVRSADHNILVDTSSSEYRPRLVDGLSRAGLQPRDIDILVNTHAHYDHNSNNDLFPEARLYAHPSDRPRGRFTPVEAEELELGPMIKIVHTPGHSPGSISLYVRSDVRTVIAGDAIPTEDNYLKDVPPAHHTDREQAVASMHKILSWAERVVPGHGPAFLVGH